MSKFDLTGDQICYRLDRLTEHYRKRHKIADKRWDWLQDARKIEEDANGEDTILGERLSHLCGRAEKQTEELVWRIKELGKAYNALEEIEMSIDNIRQDNKRYRENEKKRKLITAAIDDLAQVASATTRVALDNIIQQTAPEESAKISDIVTNYLLVPKGHGRWLLKSSLQKVLRNYRTAPHESWSKVCYPSPCAGC